MTVRLLVPAYGKQTNALYTGTTAEERALIDAGQADNNLSASFDYPDYLAGKSLATPSLYGIDLTARNRVDVIRTAKDIIMLDVLPQDASGQSTYNGTSYVQSGTATVGNDLYALNYEPGGSLIISKKRLPNGAWTTFSLQTLQTGPGAAPLFLPVDNDPHNNFSMVIDGSGYIHISANMHGDTLRYIRSTNPYDITAWTAPGMTGSNEAQVTYPRFVKFSDGAIACMFRDGESGGGDVYLNYKAAGQQAWVQRPMVAAGKVNSENPYESRLIVDRQDRLWVAFTWRPSGGNADTNADVHLIRSPDRGLTWQTVTGVAVAAPLVHSNMTARALTTAATNSGIINQFGLDVDMQGNPHIALQLADARPDAPATFDRNIHHLYWSGSAWVNEQVTDLRNTMSLLNWTTRPFMACSSDGRNYIAYTTRRFGAKAGTVRMIDVTTNAPVEFSVCDIPPVDFEITAADDAMRDQNLFRCLVSTTNSEVTNPGPDYNDGSAWTRQWIGVLSIDMSRMADIASGRVRVPYIRQIASVVVNANTAIADTAGANAAITGAPAILTAVGTRFKKVMARLSARVRPTGGTTDVVISEFQQGQALGTGAKISYTDTSSSVYKGTPWVPLKLNPLNGVDTQIGLLGKTNTGTTATIAGLTLEAGVIDGPVRMPVA
jgi:hypothetical protein